MTVQFKDIELHALSLPVRQRRAPVGWLLENLDDVLLDDTPDAVALAWQDEIALRVTEFEVGKAQGVPHDQVMADLRTLIGKHSSH